MSENRNVTVPVGKVTRPLGFAPLSGGIRQCVSLAYALEPRPGHTVGPRILRRIRKNRPGKFQKIWILSARGDQIGKMAAFGAGQVRAGIH
jgi:hypothetical protein